MSSTIRLETVDAATLLGRTSKARIRLKSDWTGTLLSVFQVSCVFVFACFNPKARFLAFFTLVEILFTIVVPCWGRVNDDDTVTDNLMAKKEFAWLLNVLLEWIRPFCLILAVYPGSGTTPNFWCHFSFLTAWLCCVQRLQSQSVIESVCCAVIYISSWALFEFWDVYVPFSSFRCNSHYDALTILSISPLVIWTYRHAALSMLWGFVIEQDLRRFEICELESRIVSSKRDVCVFMRRLNADFRNCLNGMELHLVANRERIGSERDYLQQMVVGEKMENANTITGRGKMASESECEIEGESEEEEVIGIGTGLRLRDDQDGDRDRDQDRDADAEGDCVGDEDEPSSSEAEAGGFHLQNRHPHSPGISIPRFESLMIDVKILAVLLRLLSGFAAPSVPVRVPVPVPTPRDLPSHANVSSVSPSVFAFLKKIVSRVGFGFAMMVVPSATPSSSSPSSPAYSDVGDEDSEYEHGNDEANRNVEVDLAEFFFGSSENATPTKLSGSRNGLSEFFLSSGLAGSGSDGSTSPRKAQHLKACFPFPTTRFGLNPNASVGVNEKVVSFPESHHGAQGDGEEIEFEGEISFDGPTLPLPSEQLDLRLNLDFNFGVGMVGDSRLPSSSSEVRVESCGVEKEEGFLVKMYRIPNVVVLPDVRILDMISFVPVCLAEAEKYFMDSGAVVVPERGVGRHRGEIEIECGPGDTQELFLVFVGRELSSPTSASELPRDLEDVLPSYALLKHLGVFMQSRFRVFVEEIFHGGGGGCGDGAGSLHSFKCMCRLTIPVDFDTTTLSWEAQAPVSALVPQEPMKRQCPPPPECDGDDPLAIYDGGTFILIDSNVINRMILEKTLSLPPMSFPEILALESVSEAVLVLRAAQKKVSAVILSADEVEAEDREGTLKMLRELAEPSTRFLLYTNSSSETTEFDGILQIPATLRNVKCALADAAVRDVPLRRVNDHTSGSLDRSTLIRNFCLFHDAIVTGSLLALWNFDIRLFFFVLVERFLLTTPVLFASVLPEPPKYLFCGWYVLTGLAYFFDIVLLGTSSLGIGLVVASNVVWLFLSLKKRDMDALLRLVPFSVPFVFLGDVVSFQGLLALENSQMKSVAFAYIFMSLASLHHAYQEARVIGDETILNRVNHLRSVLHSHRRHLRVVSECMCEPLRGLHNTIMSVSPEGSAALAMVGHMKHLVWDMCLHSMLVGGSFRKNFPRTPEILDPRTVFESCVSRVRESVASPLIFNIGDQVPILLELDQAFVDRVIARIFGGFSRRSASVSLLEVSWDSNVLYLDFCLIISFAESAEMQLLKRGRLFDPFAFESEVVGGDEIPFPGPVYSMRWASLREFCRRVLDGDIVASFESERSEVRFSVSMNARQVDLVDSLVVS